MNLKSIYLILNRLNNCVDDVVKSGAFDRAINHNRRSSLKAQSYSPVNRFKMI